jgi:hypothetical protein
MVLPYWIISDFINPVSALGILLGCMSLEMYTLRGKIIENNLMNVCENRRNCVTLRSQKIFLFTHLQKYL